MSKKLKQMLAAYGLVLPSFLTVMLVVAWPILTAIKTSFTDPDTGGFTFDNYKYFFETPRERPISSSHWVLCSSPWH